MKEKKFTIAFGVNFVPVIDQSPQAWEKFKKRVEEEYPYDPYLNKLAYDSLKFAKQQSGMDVSDMTEPPEIWTSFIEKYGGNNTSDE